MSNRGGNRSTKPGKPIASRVFSCKNQSNTVSKAPAELRGSPRDNKFLFYPPLAARQEFFTLFFAFLYNQSKDGCQFFLS